MKDENCIFCKIVAREIPTEIIAETEHTVSFVDIMPANFGHSLVIPKEHFANIHELPEEIASVVFKEAKRLATAVQSAVGADGINIIMNNGKASGQVIFHAHVHIIPRLETDGFTWWPPKKYEFPTQMQELGEKIRKNLSLTKSTP